MKLRNKKVYLSVSYRTPIEFVNYIKELLEEAGAKVLMYQKHTETYTVRKIFASDILISLPPPDYKGVSKRR